MFYINLYETASNYCTVVVKKFKFQHNECTKVQRKLAQRDLKASVAWIQL